MVINLWRYKSFIFNNALNDLKHRYAGSAMGVFWNILNPLSQILVFTVVLSRIMQVRVQGMSATAGFAIYLCAGMLPWVSFNECINRGTNSFRSNANYLKKLPIPEQVFVAQSAMSATMGAFISMTLLLLITLVMGLGMSWTWALVPLILILMQSFGFGIGLMLSSLNVFFQDIGEMLGVILRVWIWLTPIIYTKDILPENLMVFMNLNPVFPFIDALHNAIVYKEPPVAWHWGAMAAYALVTPVIGYLILKKLRPEIRDVL